MPLKNAFSRAIFGYKRQKSESLPTSNSGRSPATKVAMKKYDILPTRGNDDALLLPTEMEQNARNGDTVHNATSKSEVQLLSATHLSCSEPLSEGTMIQKRRSISENESRDFKGWHSNSGRPTNRFDESCPRDVAAESQVLSKDCKIFNKGLSDESKTKNFEAWIPSPAKPTNPFGLPRKGDPAESPVLNQRQKQRLSCENAEQDLNTPQRDPALVDPFVGPLQRKTYTDEKPESEDHRTSNFRSGTEGEKDLQLRQTKVARSPNPLVSSDNLGGNQIVKNSTEVTSTGTGLRCDHYHFDFPELNEQHNQRWSCEKDMQNYKKWGYPASIHSVVGSRQMDGNAGQVNSDRSSNPFVPCFYGDFPGRNEAIRNGNNQVTSSGTGLSCDNDHLNDPLKSKWETNPFNDCGHRDFSVHSQSVVPKATSVPSYPNHLNLSPATLGRANLNMKTKPKADYKSVHALYVGISRQRDDVPALQPQSPGFIEMPPDTKKIIPHVLPISPLNNMSPLPPTSLAPSPLRPKLPSPLKSRLSSPLRSRASSPFRIPPLLMPGSRSPDPPVFATHLHSLDPPTSSASRVRPSKEGDSSANFRFVVPTRGLAKPSIAPVPSRRDTPPRPAQSRGSGRNSPTSPFLNQEPTTRHSESVERGCSGFGVFSKTEQATKVRQQRMSKSSTTQEFTTRQTPKRQSSAKSSLAYKQHSSLPAPLSRGLMFHEMEGRSAVQTAILEFDRLAERKSSNRFVDAPQISLPGTHEVHLRMTEPPSCTVAKLNVLVPTVQNPVRQMKIEASVRSISPRQMRCFSEDSGNTAATGCVTDTPQGVSLKSAEFTDVTAHGLGFACRIPDLLESSPLNGAESNEASVCWLGPSFTANQTADLTLSLPLKSIDSSVRSGCREQVHGRNSSIEGYSSIEEGCFDGEDAAALDGLEDNQPNLLAAFEMLMKTPLLESRRVLNVDDPSRCTFWVSDGSCQHLEIDVKNGQPVVLVKDSSLAKKERLTPTSTYRCSLKTLGQISLEDVLEVSTFPKSCTTPSKKTNGRRKIKASLSFRSNSSKNRIRRNFSFGSVR